MRARNFLMFLFITTAAISLAPLASAHHSFAAEYDADRPVTLTGTVTKMAWINPHSWIYIDVKKADGSVDSWAVEAGPPGTLVRAGFTKNSLAPGTGIKVNGYRAKDGALRERTVATSRCRMADYSLKGGSSPGAPKEFPGEKSKP